MAFDDVAIRVRNISKHYLLFNRPEDRLKQMIVPRLQRLVGRPPARYYRDFAALSGVSFDVRRGETVGIVGRNGSGKSTLLQVICGTLRPTTGTVETKGRIAALLELASGFNPELTGRENVYLKAALLGLSRRETDARFEAIERFADIGIFIDQPVKTYSSGMFVRLAFAVNACVEPEILVVDEALAVGDEAFQRKCYARIEGIKERGGTILFVSHGAQTIIQLCDRALLFDGGELILAGKPKPVISQYQRLLNLAGPELIAARAEIRARQGEDAAAPGASQAGVSAPVKPARSPESYDPGLQSKSRVDYESSGALIRNIRLLNGRGDRVNILAVGERYRAAYDLEVLEPARNVSLGFLIKTLTGVELTGGNTATVKERQLPAVAAGQTLAVEFGFTCRLLPGTYAMNVGAMGTRGDETGYLHRILDALIFRVAPRSGSLDYGYLGLDVSLDVRPLASDAEAPSRAAAEPTSSG